MKLLIIGMGPGNGLSLAQRFGREGYEVIMVARSEEKLVQFSKELSDSGIKSAFFTTDLTNVHTFETVMNDIIRIHPDLDILHYNASAYNPALPSSTEVDTFLKDLNINITGALVAAKVILPAMKSRQSGTIFITGGGTAFKAPANLFSLAIGKAGIRHLAYALADECRADNIKVATVTINGMVKKGGDVDPDAVADLFWQINQSPLGAFETELIIP